MGNKADINLIVVENKYFDEYFESLIEEQRYEEAILICDRWSWPFDPCGIPQDYLLKAAKCYMFLNQYEKALKYLMFGVNRPHSYNLLNQIVQVYIVLQKYQEVDNWIDRSLKILPNSKAYFYRGLINLNKLNYNKAEKYFKQSLKIKDSLQNQCLILIELAQIYLQRKQITKAIQLLNEALNKNENFALTYLVLAQLYSTIDQYKKADSILRIALSKNLTREGKSSIYRKIGRNRVVINQILEGINFLKKSLQINPFNIRAVLQLGLAYISLKDYQQAEKYFEQLLPNERFINCIYYYFSFQLLANKQIKTAQKIIKLSQHKHCFKCLLARGLLHLHKLQYDMTEYYFEKTMNEYKRPMHLIIFYINQNDQIKAKKGIKICIQQLNKYNSNYQLYQKLGRLYMINNQRTKAEQCFLKSKMLRPNYYEAYYALANFYQRKFITYKAFAINCALKEEYLRQKGVLDWQKYLKDNIYKPSEFDSAFDKLGLPWGLKQNYRIINIHCIQFKLYETLQLNNNSRKWKELSLSLFKLTKQFLSDIQKQSISIEFGITDEQTIKEQEKEIMPKILIQNKND